MQDEQQFEQLMLQYRQLKNGADDMKKMIEDENFDAALTMLKSREALFASCKCIRRYLELTPVQKKELEKLLDELRELEISNIKKLEAEMNTVKHELTISQRNAKLQHAYDFDEDLKGSIINVSE
jgi:hypothetical protein